MWRILSELPESEGFALAGGAALIMSGVVDRTSEDLDIFGKYPVEVTELVEAAVRALNNAGLTTTVDRSGPTYARLDITDGANSTWVDFATDVRRRPAVRGSLIIGEPRFLSIDRVNRTAVLSDEEFSLRWDSASVRRDARLMLKFFGNYEGAFEGDVPMLQRDYFTFMAWLYFSPLICDLRSLAYLQDSDVVRYPSFAIIFGKSNCGKTSLVDTLMASMFGRPHTVEKRSFTTAKLRGLQHAYKRHPVVFDDIGRRAFNTHGKDLIKDEYPPQVTEYPGFVLSMNAEPHSFPDEIVKRSLTIYTTTALPAHDEQLRRSTSPLPDTGMTWADGQGPGSVPQFVPLRTDGDTGVVPVGSGLFTSTASRPP